MNCKSIKLVLSSMVILMCLILITLSTFALYTETILINQHLQSGTLDIELKRTNLKYNYLSENGYFVEKENFEIIDFSNTYTTRNNIFDITEKTLIIPGSYFNASMKLYNKGNVPFIYWIEVVLKDYKDNILASQLEVIVTIYDNLDKKEYISNLDEGLILGNEVNPLGEMMVNSSPLKFDIKITFIDSISNNNAKNENVNFDIIVHAVQKIK